MKRTIRNLVKNMAFGLAVASFGVLVSLLIANSPKAKALTKQTIILDWFINPDHGPLIIAQEKGYFKEQGIDLEIIAPADPADPPKLVAAGKADLAVTYQPELYLQLQEGLPLQRVGALIASPLNCLLVMKEGPIQSIADLKGKKIGFSVSGVERAILSAILAHNGLSLDDVELVNVGWSLSPSLMSGQVDAVIGGYRNFELNQMDINAAPGRCFYVEEQGIPAYDELIYVANSEKMNKDAIARFMAAVEKATRFIVNNPKESWEIFKNTSPELDDDLNARAWLDTVSHFALRPAALDRGRYARFGRFLKDAGLTRESIPVDRLAIDVTK